MSGLWLAAQRAADGVWWGGVKAHRAYVGAYVRCLSEQMASLAEPYPSPDIDEVKRAP
jgi:hypothetical protein